MIDLHSHILPNVDDGAANMTEALQMLQLAVAEGVDTQVLTPHIHPYRYGNNPTSLRHVFEKFTARVKQEGISIELLLAAEVRIGPELLQQVVADDMPWLGEWQGEKVFLLEMPYNEIPVGSINVIQRLRDQHIRPLIAHPERINKLHAKLDKLTPFIEAGCLLQITSASLTGHFGRAAFVTAKTLLRQGYVTVIATDCHNLTLRPPALRSGVEIATEIIGASAAKALVSTNPARILKRLRTNT